MAIVVEVSKTTLPTILILVFMMVAVNEVSGGGRSLHDSSTSSKLVSDGVDDHGGDQEPSSFVSLMIMRAGGMDSSHDANSDSEDQGEYYYYCEQMYGFLPCSNSLLGHLFLIVVYEYLLFHGESYVASGGERIFKILGPGIFGASAFQIIGAFPESLILLASGLLNSKEVAQEYVLTGVGLLAGSTIFVLTLLWGTCVIVGSREFSPNSNSSSDASPPSVNGQNHYKQLSSLLTGTGVTTDLETSYTARIMCLSVIPFIVILIPRILNESAGGYSLILITLIISVVFLLVYFVYQMFEPWIQKRRLEFVKHEHLIVEILKHVQEHTAGRLLTEDGAPNVPAIKRLFKEVDHDGDNYISFSELKELLQEIKLKKLPWDKEKTMEEVIREFDCDGDKKITMDEFVDTFTKWLDETKLAMDKRYHSRRSLKDLYLLLQPWIQKKKKEHEIMNDLVSEIIHHVQISPLGGLFTEDGTPDVSAIKRLFQAIDLDKDNSISQSELKILMMDVNFGKITWDVDAAVSKVMEALDKSGDHLIDEEEFISGFTEWLNTSSNHALNSPESIDSVYQKPWEETDLLVEETKMDKALWAWAKAVMLLVLGIAMLGVLAEPLIHSVHKVSESASLPTFLVSFILVPVATNARVATSAIEAVRRKKPRTTSLTFSEIYNGVFMNNILEFSVLLSVIYFRELSWHFNAEVLAVLCVCGVMGLAASFRSKFPIWTSVLAFLLYPASLILVYVLEKLECPY